MKVKTIQNFHDLEHGRLREENEIFEVNKERSNKLIRMGLVELAQDSGNVKLKKSKEAE